MTRVLVVYYSSYGHVRALAQAEAEGARSIPGTHVDLRRVPETVPEAIRQKARSFRRGRDAPSRLRPIWKPTMPSSSGRRRFSA